jgi:hypothetical protein
MSLDFQCGVVGLPKPEREVRFSPPRRWRFDYAWPEYKVALEIEGGAWTKGRHTRGAGFIKDMEKYSEAAIMGWCVLRLTPTAAREMGVFLVARALTARGCHVPAVVALAQASMPSAEPVRRRSAKSTGAATRKRPAPISASGPRRTPTRSGNTVAVTT